MFLAEASTDYGPLTAWFAGIGSFFVGQILHGIIRDKFYSKRENTKVSELTQQTQLSQEQRDFMKKLVELAEEEKKERQKMNKKILESLKRVHKKVKIVQAQTAPAQKI